MPSDCLPGDYRPECFPDPDGGEVGSPQCGPGSHWSTADGACVPDSTPGGENPCPEPGMRPGGPGESRCVPIGYNPAGLPQSQVFGGYGDFKMPDWQPFKYDFNFGDAPGFKARRFTPPNPQDLLNDPSYKWRLDQSLGALQNSAASRGVARTGNTAKGLIDYAGSSASQEYGNAFDRALKVFGTDYQGDLDEYKPKLITYQTKAAGQQRAQELSALDLWRKYLADMDWSKFLLSQDA